MRSGGGWLRLRELELPNALNMLNGPGIVTDYAWELRGQNGQWLRYLW